MNPQRIQLRRTKGWRKPEEVVVVARPSKWGNPFRVSPFMGGWSVDGRGEHFDVYEQKSGAVREAVALYRIWLRQESRLDVGKLCGRDLACWCPLDQPCHADVLLEVANQ